MDKRLLLLIFIAGLAGILKAGSGADLLRKANDLYYADNDDEALAMIMEIPISAIEAEQDSVIFEYCYLYAAMTERSDSTEDTYRRNIINRGIDLLETVLPIHTPRYLELLNALADYQTNDDDDIEAAIKTYQRGLIIGASLTTDINGAFWYGTFMWQLAELYEQKGYLSQMEQLYNSVADYMPPETGIAHVGLSLLSGYYHRQGRYSDAAHTNRRALSLIESTLGKVSEEYLSTSLSLAYNLGNDGDYAGSVATLVSSLRLCLDNGITGECFDNISEAFSALDSIVGTEELRRLLENTDPGMTKFIMEGLNR